MLTELGVANSVVLAPWSTVALDAGFVVPEPVWFTVRVYWLIAKLAWTSAPVVVSVTVVLAAFGSAMVTPLPSSSVQLTKWYPVAGVATTARATLVST